MHEKRNTKQKNDERLHRKYLLYLLDRGTISAKVLLQLVLNRNEREGGKMKSLCLSTCPRRNRSIKSYLYGKRKKKAWKRTVTKECALLEMALQET